MFEPTISGFEVVKDISGILLDRRTLEQAYLGIAFSKGDCAMDPLDSFVKRLSWEDYLKNVLEPAIRRGEVSNGSKGGFDDRKLRFSHASLQGGLLEIGLGITTYQEMASDIHRPLEENIRLMGKGKDSFDNPYAFFSRAAAVAVLPISLQGHVFLSQRVGTKDYPGWLNGAAGYLRFKNLNELNLEDEAYFCTDREMKFTHVNITSLSFVGVYGNPRTGEVDFTFLARTNIPDIYFTSPDGLRTNMQLSGINIGPIVEIPTYEDVQKVIRGEPIQGLENVPGIMYSTRGALMSLRPEDMKSE